MTEERAHSKLGASSAKRWMTCSGSVNLIDKFALWGGGGSTYAKEGTAAHGVGEQCLQSVAAGEDIIDAWVFAGEKIEVEGETFEVDDEMVAAVQVYIDTICSDLAAEDAENGWPVLEVETPAELIDLHPDLWGTSDAALIGKTLLRVYDFKYGKGIVVEVEKNEQGMQYAAGVLHRVATKYPGVTDVEIVIVQPRAPHPDGPVRRWRISVEDLGDWVSEELVPAAFATEAPDAPRVAGDHCRFCPAKDRCEAYDAIFDDFETDLAPGKMSDQDLAKRLESVALVVKYAGQLKDEAFRRLTEGEAGKYLKASHKLVRGKSNRVFPETVTITVNDKSETVNVEEKLKEKFGDAIYTEPKIKTPAQIEKLAGVVGAKKKVAEYAFKPDGALTLALASDKRDAVVIERDPNVVFADLI